MSGLLHTEAVERAAGVRVEHYRLCLDLPEDGPVFECETTVRFTATAPATFVELRAEALLTATLDGVGLDAGRWDGRRFPLTGLAGSHELVLRARMAYSHDGEGLHRFVDPADGLTYLCATSAVDNAPRWFACFDQPDLKASYSLQVRCPDAWTVVGNGASTRVAPGVWELATTAPLSTYHVTLVAGPWHSVHGEHDGVPLALHARASLAAELDRDAPELLQLTADSLDAFHALFAVPYPFGQYHQAFVPEFNWGAMENPGCVTFRDQLIFRSRPTEEDLVGRATTVVHEMAHMWFGDLVTMRWWDDLWLNESFAEYLGHRIGAQVTDLPVWEDFAVSRKSWGYAADRRPSTHPVAATAAPDAATALEDFDGISYAKGASVLRQLAVWLGDDVFLAGLRDHITAHAYGNATFDDLVEAWAGALARSGAGITAADLRAWTTAWLRTEGVDVVGVEALAGGTPALVRADPAVGPASARPHACSVAVVPDGPVWPVVLDAAPVPLPLSGVTTVATTWADGGLLVPNAGDETWATVRLAEQDWARLPEVLPRVPPGRTRVVLWNALRSALADGLVTPALAVATVAAALPGELDVVTGPVLRWIAAALPRYVAPGPERERLQERLVRTGADLLAGAEPGGAVQLTAARCLAAATPDVDLLRAWRAGATAAPGLVVDLELAWVALERRAALGDLDEDALAAELTRDRTASATVHAARARALRPDAAAKAAAWATVTDPDGTASQYELAATAEGIWVAGQEALAAPYAARWFDQIAATAAYRSGWALTRVAQACFPALAVEASTLARATRFVADPQIPTPLRRVAADQADDLRRALAVRTGAGDAP